jgi:hypothetical protein
MADFRCAEYSEGKMVADEETIKRLLEIGIRKTARETGIHSDTVTLITRREPVKPITLAKVLGFIQQHNDK